MYFTYILFSEKANRYYIGYSEDPQKRLFEKHNKGFVKSTRNGKPYVIVKTKMFETEIEARTEELRLKKMKSRKYIESLIDGNW